MRILYPRKCLICSHTSNNPAMYSYHKRIHDLVPIGKLCDHGCGQYAKFKNTNNKFTCEKNAHRCKAYLKGHIERIKQQWNRPDANKRRLLAAVVFNKAVNNKACIEKGKQTKRIKILSYDNTKTRRRYNYAVHKLSQETYIKNNTVINPNNIVLGRKTFHLDHLVSKHIGFLLNIPIIYMSSIHNLCILPYKSNTSKGPKCSIHPIKLLILCNADDVLINTISQKILVLSCEHLLPQQVHMPLNEIYEIVSHLL